MRNFFVSVRGIEQGGAPQCASKAPVGLCLARGRFPFGSYRLKGFPLWGKLSPQVTDEGEFCGNCNNTGWFVAAGGHFPLIRRVPRHLPPRGKAFAEGSHPVNETQRANRTGRIYASPTNLPEIGTLPITAYLPVIRREGS